MTHTSLGSSGADPQAHYSKNVYMATVWKLSKGPDLVFYWLALCVCHVGFPPNILDWLFQNRHSALIYQIIFGYHEMTKVSLFVVLKNLKNFISKSHI